MEFKNELKKIAREGVLVGALGAATIAGASAQEIDKGELDKNKIEKVNELNVLSPEIQAVAQKIGFKINFLGEHPNGGLNFKVECPSIQGSQIVQGVDSSSVTEDGNCFVLIRNAHIDSATVKESGDMITFNFNEKGEVIEDEKKIIKEITKTSYFFTKQDVTRVITFSDGSIDRSVVLR